MAGESEKVTVSVSFELDLPPDADLRDLGVRLRQAALNMGGNAVAVTFGSKGVLAGVAVENSHGPDEVPYPNLDLSVTNFLPAAWTTALARLEAQNVTTLRHCAMLGGVWMRGMPAVGSKIAMNIRDAAEGFYPSLTIPERSTPEWVAGLCTRLEEVPVQAVLPNPYLTRPVITASGRDPGRMYSVVDLIAGHPELMKILVRTPMNAEPQVRESALVYAAQFNAARVQLAGGAESV